MIVDADGQITLVECKLAANPQVRREIIGQVFDYASRLWKMDVTDFDSRWRSRNQTSLFQDEVVDEFNLKEAVKNNLANGRFRIVLAVDSINPSLKTIVEYLNFMAGAATTVIAVKYTHLVHGSVELLMPKTYGQELAEAKRSSEIPSRETWNPSTHREWLTANDPANLEKFNLLISEAAGLGVEYHGSDSLEPAGGLRVVTPERQWVGSLNIYYYTGQRTSLELNFIRQTRLEDPDGQLSAKFRSYLQKLEQFPELGAAVGLLRSAPRTKRPNIPFGFLSEDSIRGIVAALRVFVE